MKKLAPLTRWIIEFDFGSDPEVSPESVEVALKDQLEVSSNFVMIDNHVYLEGTDEAFALKMSLGHHIVSVTKQSIAA